MPEDDAVLYLSRFSCSRFFPRRLMPGPAAVLAALLLPSGLLLPGVLSGGGAALAASAAPPSVVQDGSPSSSAGTPALHPVAEVRPGAVTVSQQDGHWTFMVDGKPFPLRGVATGDRPWDLSALPALGATVIRTYRQEDAFVLDKARDLGLKVIVGLWMQHPRHGFDWQSPAAVAAQEREILAFVKRWQNHPAVLAWGVGNEVETGVEPAEGVWKLVDRMAQKIKEQDPSHPTVMVVGDGDGTWMKPLASCCEHVDVLGINIYAGSLFNLPERLAAAGIRKPVLVAELGPLGHWQAGKMPWGAPVELSSTQKASYYRAALPFISQHPAFIGGLPFLWGAKQEQTSTWYGLLLEDGTPTGQVDAISAAWGGWPPSVARYNNQAPQITGAGLSAATFAPGEAASAGIIANDPEETPLRWSAGIVAEATDLRKGGDAEAPPARAPGTVDIRPGPVFAFTAPATPGAWRLFITVRDTPPAGVDSKAATINLPFLVRAAGENRN